MRERIIGRWSEEREVITFHSVVSNRFGVTSEMSGEVEGPSGGALVGEFSFRTPKEEEVMASKRASPLGSWFGENQRPWWALKSPRIMWLSP